MEFDGLERELKRLCRGEDPIDRERTQAVLEYTIRWFATRLQENLLLAVDRDGKVVLRKISTAGLCHLVAHPDIEKLFRTTMGESEYENANKFDTTSSYLLYKRLRDEAS